MIIDKQIIRDWDVYYEDDIELIETSELNHWYEETLGYQPYRLYEYLTNQYQDTNILDIGTEYGFSAVSFAKNRSNKVDTWDLHRYSTFEKITINLHPEVSCDITLNVARSLEEASKQKKLGKAITSNSENEDNKNEGIKTDTSEEPSKQNEMLTDEKKDTNTNSDDLNDLDKNTNASDRPTKKKKLKILR